MLTQEKIEKFEAILKEILDPETSFNRIFDLIYFSDVQDDSIDFNLYLTSTGNKMAFHKVLVNRTTKLSNNEEERRVLVQEIAENYAEYLKSKEENK